MKKEIPILFSTDMVKAILAGRKTKTRRTSGLDEVNKEPDKVEFVRFQEYPDGTVRAIFHHEDSDDDGSVKCPYGKPGDIIWVRESWNRADLANDHCLINYKADHAYPDEYKWKPSIHMPKEAARIWLEVSDIKVERLHDITEEDAIAEGVQRDKLIHHTMYRDYYSDASGYGDPEYDFPLVSTAVESFTSLWMKINGEESWEMNPWVWVVSFKVLSTTGKPKDIPAPFKTINVRRKGERASGAKYGI